MAKIFDGTTGNRIVPIWHAAATHLLHAHERTDMNLVLEIIDPMTVTEEDKKLMRQIDVALKSPGCDLTLDTVASTIFPYRMYERHGRPAMYKKYFSALDRGKKSGTWGTYAERIMSHPAKDGINTINPLNMLVEKLRTNGKARQSFKSAYELNLSDPEADLAPILDLFGDGGDIPTYKAVLDAKATRNRPCLSHVSFKLVDTDKVNLTAIYRSHHYCARALGNLVGLARLLNFVAKEAELEVGQLTCISTFATLDTSTWGGVTKTRKLLGSYKPD
ncbi:thymidylate synthase family protein [Undibacterium curvum]|uniref:Thymidylate synthase n=1 Tax=Undibacterium curvum TaxID=2762294 RepID=A0ABR7A6V1_9BURK|nr:hypothetical protein [Undibacterium curvum]MBC3932626.1 hypothetical protein [Undibacterium curvum]